MEPVTSLWVVTGNSPVAFALPVKVIDSNYRLLEVQPAVPMLKIQEHALSEIFSMSSKVGERDGKIVWLITYYLLRRIASKVHDQTVDPEKLVVWSRELNDNRHHMVKKFATDRDDFLEFCYTMGLGNTITETYYFWGQFTKLMAEWIINRERVIDLGFANLRNCPFRHDWKVILSWCYPEHMLGTKHLKGGHFRKNLSKVWKSGAIKSLFSLDLVAFKNSNITNNLKHCMRHINVELKLPWYKMMMARERDKLKHLGEQEYAMQHMESVRSNIRYWVADFTRWCLEIARPSASCNKVYGKSSFRLVQNLRAKTMYWKTLFIVNAPSLYRRQFKPFQPNCVARDLLKENPFVPLVSALEPKPENVRDTQGSLEEPVEP